MWVSWMRPLSPLLSGCTADPAGYGEQSIGEYSIGVPAAAACQAEATGVLKLKFPADGPKPRKLPGPLPPGCRLWASVLREGRLAVPVTGVLPGVNMLTLGVKAPGVFASTPTACAEMLSGSITVVGQECHKVTHHA